jgi:hypothetical protein
MATQNAIGRLDKTQAIPFTATPASSAAISSQIYKLRLVSTTACFFTIGAATAVYLPANLPEYVICTPGQLITGIVQATAAGTLYISEIA